jgi:hypothetical protein
MLNFIVLKCSGIIVLVHANRQTAYTARLLACKILVVITRLIPTMCLDLTSTIAVYFLCSLFLPVSLSLGSLG